MRQEGVRVASGRRQDNLASGWRQDDVKRRGARIKWCAATRAPETPAQRYAAIPLKGWGPDTRPRPTVIRGAGPDQPWDTETGEWLQAAPGLQTGWTGDVSSLVRTPVPPRIVLCRQRTPGYGDTHMGTRRGRRPVAPPGGRGRPARRGALQRWGAGIRRRLGDTQGSLLLMLPTDIAAALRQELDGCEGLRVG